MAQRLRRMEWIARTQAQLAELGFDLDGFMQSVVDRIPEMTPADGVVVELVCGDEMSYRAASRHLSHFLGLRLKRAGSLSGLCAERAETLYCVDAEQDERVDREACRRIGLRSMVCAPLMAGETVVGALKALSATPGRFGEEDIEVLELLGKTLGAALGKQLSFDALRAQTELFENAFSHAPIGLALVSLDGRILKVNDALAAIMDQSPAQLLGVAFQDITHPDDLGRDLELLAELHAGRCDNYQMDKRYLRKDGSVVWVNLSVSIQRQPDGTPAHYIAQVQDLTVRKAAEAALVEARLQAEQAAATKAEFLANVSHELRTPVTSIIGFTALACEHGGLDDLTRTYLERAREAGQGLLCLVNDVLDFSKLEAGQVSLSPRPTDVAALARSALDLFTPQAGAKDLALSLDLPEGAPEGGLELSVDPDRIRQVLLNLIGNAIKFTERGGVTLRLDHRDGDLRVEVADTGMGVAPAKQQQLFQRFSQVDGSLTRETVGTGLGLAICKGLIEAMGGRIGLDSELEKGSTFWFVIPAAQASAERDRLIGQAVKTPVEGVRVLVVDDHRANRELARLYLDSVRAEVVEAVNGAEAVERAMEWPFDVILMDLHMPELNGIAALKRIRAESRLNDITPVLAFTADGDAQALPRLLAEGFDGIVRKPIEPLAFLGAIAKASDFAAEPTGPEAAAGG